MRAAVWRERDLSGIADASLFERLQRQAAAIQSQYADLCHRRFAEIRRSPDEATMRLLSLVDRVGLPQRFQPQQAPSNGEPPPPPHPPPAMCDEAVSVVGRPYEAAGRRRRPLGDEPPAPPGPPGPAPLGGHGAPPPPQLICAGQLFWPGVYPLPDPGLMAAFFRQDNVQVLNPKP